METFDIKRERRDLYAPKPGDFQVVDVPGMGFVMVDGHGDPNTAPAYRDAVAALYTTSYQIRAIAKQQLGRAHVVAPLEGLWSAPDLGVFLRGEKDSWDWTMMIAQPDWISPEIFEEAVRMAAQKAPATDRVRFERFDEGRSVQILHIGSYDDEAPTIARLHEEFLPAQGLLARGRHHEIYVSDPRKTAAAKLKTVLRQPISHLSR